MLDWLADHLALIMFVSMFFFIFIGYPVAFIMGGLALIFAIIGSWLGVFKLIGLSDVVLRMWGGVAADPVLASIPMFIFMGAILERSGSAKDMLDATVVLLKRCPGALAVSVMVMGTILAAPIGVVGAAVITLSVIALPQMLAAGYDKTACHRHHRLGRNARHPHSAGHHAGGDGGDAGHLGRQPVPRRHHAGPPAVGPLPRLHRARRDLQAGRGAQAAGRLRAADPRASSGTRCGAACSP